MHRCAEETGGPTELRGNTKFPGSLSTKDISMAGTVGETTERGGGHSLAEPVRASSCRLEEGITSRLGNLRGVSEENPDTCDNKKKKTSKRTRVKRPGEGRRVLKEGEYVCAVFSVEGVGLSCEGEEVILGSLPWLREKCGQKEPSKERKGGRASHLSGKK